MSHKRRHGPPANRNQQRQYDAPRHVMSRGGTGGVAVHDGGGSDNGNGGGPAAIVMRDADGRPYVMLADSAGRGGYGSSTAYAQGARQAQTATAQAAQAMQAYNSPNGGTGFAAKPYPDMPKVSDAKPLLRSMGATGTAIFSGIITSEEYNEDFYWKDAIQVYEQMIRNDAQIFAVVQLLELPIRRAIWTIEPGTDDPHDAEIASFVETCLFHEMQYVTSEGRTLTQKWDDILRHILMMLRFGFMAFEVNWRLEDGWTKWARWTPLLPRTIWRWWVGDDNELVGLQQWTFKNYTYQFVDIPADKLLLFVHRQEGNNYEGVSVLRSAYKHWYYKDNFYKIEAIDIERNAAEIPVIYLPETVTDTDLANAQSIMQNMRVNENMGVSMPPGWKIEYIRTYGRQTAGVQPSIAHHDNMIARNVLGQFINLGSQEVGSYALAETQRAMLLSALQAECEYIEDVINNDAIPRLVDYNFEGVENYPRIKASKLIAQDLDVISTALNKLNSAPSGPLIHGDPDLEDYLRDLYGLPKAPAGVVQGTNPTAESTPERPETDTAAAAAGGDDHADAESKDQQPTDKQQAVSQAVANGAPNAQNTAATGNPQGGAAPVQAADAANADAGMAEEARLLREALAAAYDHDAVERGLQFFNPAHVPAGSPAGGEFASKGGGEAGGGGTKRGAAPKTSGGGRSRGGGGAKSDRRELNRQIELVKQGKDPNRVPKPEEERAKTRADKAMERMNRDSRSVYQVRYEGVYGGEHRYSIENRNGYFIREVNARDLIQRARDDAAQSRSIAKIQAAYHNAEMVKQGYRAWASGRAYLDNAGRYHEYKVDAEGYKTGRGPVAPWSRAVKVAHPDSMDFHRAAESYAAAHPDEMPPHMKGGQFAEVEGVDADSIRLFNPMHYPGGSRQGGQFAPKGGGGIGGGVGAAGGGHGARGRAAGSGASGRAGAAHHSGGGGSTRGSSGSKTKGEGEAKTVTVAKASNVEEAQRRVDEAEARHTEAQSHLQRVEEEMRANRAAMQGRLSARARANLHNQTIAIQIGRDEARERANRASNDLFSAKGRLKAAQAQEARNTKTRHARADAKGEAPRAKKAKEGPDYQKPGYLPKDQREAAAVHILWNRQRDAQMVGERQYQQSARTHKEQGDKELQRLARTAQDLHMQAAALAGGPLEVSSMSLHHPSEGIRTQSRTRYLEALQQYHDLQPKIAKAEARYEAARSAKSSVGESATRSGGKGADEETKALRSEAKALKAGHAVPREDIATLHNNQLRHQDDPTDPAEALARNNGNYQSLFHQLAHEPTGVTEAMAHHRNMPEDAAKLPRGSDRLEIARHIATQMAPAAERPALEKSLLREEVRMRSEAKAEREAARGSRASKVAKSEEERSAEKLTAARQRVAERETEVTSKQDRYGYLAAHSAGLSQADDQELTASFGNVGAARAALGRAQEIVAKAEGRELGPGERGYTREEYLGGRASSIEGAHIRAISPDEARAYLANPTPRGGARNATAGTGEGKSAREAELEQQLAAMKAENEALKGGKATEDGAKASGRGTRKGGKESNPGQFENLKPIGPVDLHALRPNGPMDPYALHQAYGRRQAEGVLRNLTAEDLRRSTDIVMARNPGTRATSRSRKQDMIDYIMAHLPAEPA